MTRPIIQAWADRQGRVWMDTGKLHVKTHEVIIELLNGEAKGSLSWVNSQFGPLEQLGVQKSQDAPPLNG
ncbi:hypothetical protein [Nonomuraea lactucae]|uniref:hypothetical protein n=1 Tax=Nonomuraea lactucae TaxID=2249762 RepID=UPI000DE3DB29|nr:hypothetical protein [Nonomuraea lactucae]